MLNYDIYITVLDVCRFTVDAGAAKSSCLRRSQYYYQCPMACTWNITLSKNVAQRMLELVIYIQQ